MASKRRYSDRENGFVGQGNTGSLRNGEVYANSGENPGPKTPPPNPPGTINVQTPAQKRSEHLAHIAQIDGQKLAQKGMGIEKANINPHSFGLRVAKSHNLSSRKNMKKHLAAQLQRDTGEDGYGLQTGCLKKGTSQKPFDRNKVRGKHKRRRVKNRRFGKM